MTGASKGFRESGVVLKEDPSENVEIDAEDVPEFVEQAGGRFGLTAFEVAQVDVGHPKSLGSGPLGHLPLLTKKPCRLSEW